MSDMTPQEAARIVDNAPWAVGTSRECNALNVLIDFARGSNLAEAMRQRDEAQARYGRVRAALGETVTDEPLWEQVARLRSSSGHEAEIHLLSAIGLAEYGTGDEIWQGAARSWRWGVHQYFVERWGEGADGQYEQSRLALTPEERPS